MTGMDTRAERGHRRRLMIAVGSSVASALMAGGVSIYVNQRSVDAERHAREAAATERAKASAAALAIFCRMVIAQESVFSEAQSQVGRNAAKAWHDLGVTIGCYKE